MKLSSASGLGSESEDAMVSNGGLNSNGFELEIRLESAVLDWSFTVNVVVTSPAHQVFQMICDSTLRREVGSLLLRLKVRDSSTYGFSH